MDEHQQRAADARMDKIMLRIIRRRIRELSALLLASGPFPGRHLASQELAGYRQLLERARPRKGAERAAGVLLPRQQ
jgi:hypothetical protein